MATTIAVAFIGAGRMAHLHADHLLHESDVQDLASGDPSTVRNSGQRRFCATWGGTADARNHHELLAHEAPDADLYLHAYADARTAGGWTRALRRCPVCRRSRSTSTSLPRGCARSRRRAGRWQ
ncbi:MAG: hypothetical protein U0X20_03260 [Caldilineaceae bacterium]